MKSEKEKISQFFHCKNCLSGQLALGWTKEGLLVWCEKCDKKVAHLDFQGNKVKLI